MSRNCFLSAQLNTVLKLQTNGCFSSSFPSDYSVHDFGDLNFPQVEKDEPYMDVNFPRSVGAANKMLASVTSRAIRAGHTLVMLGGDHR